MANSPAALADFYDVQEELLVYLLKYCRPAVVVENEGTLFGVYAVKAFGEEQQ